jgi:hypothetical protein
MTGYAQRVSDTVARAMSILKDRKDPAIKAQAGVEPQAVSSRANPQAIR